MPRLNKKHVILLILVLNSIVLYAGDPGYMPLAKEDFAFKKSGSSLFLNQNIEEVIGFLGDGYSEEIIKSKSNEKWDFIILNYENIQVSYTRGWKSVDRIIISDDSSFETARGIKIGSTIEDVRKLYKDILFSNYDNKLIVFYEWFDDMGIISTNYYISFTYSDDSVVERIEIGTAVD
ncbi:hypothetical protein [Spirochaeta isovalerica]|uniref:Uncharacterized protein n=1 Tax=Spirochaeta isovalerica TaxID=150 RepID=A0A841R635_9SPIO|nr:hypothetical protein [Spirochaeta isovalerica]MBB6478469.1 hypothetical protein [Spirochaeta isovalerica]